MMYRLQQFVFLSFTFLATSAVPVSAATFSVNSSSDVIDASPGDGVCETAL